MPLLVRHVIVGTSGLHDLDEPCDDRQHARRQPEHTLAHSRSPVSYTCTYLLGTYDKPVHIQTNGHEAEIRPNDSGHSLARQTTTLGQRAKPDPARDGRIEQVQIQGARTGLTTEAYVFLPPQYFQK